MIEEQIRIAKSITSQLNRLYTKPIFSVNCEDKIKELIDFNGINCGMVVHRNDVVTQIDFVESFFDNRLLIDSHTPTLYNSTRKQFLHLSNMSYCIDILKKTLKNIPRINHITRKMIRTYLDDEFNINF